MSIRGALTPYTQRPEESRITDLLQQNHILPASTHFRKHAKALDALKRLGPRQYSDFFSFAFVRNPWDWQVSLYEYMLRSKRHYQHELVKGLGGFTEYVEWRVTQDQRLQKDFITDETGTVIVDFVGRYENLAEDFQTVCQTIGITATLPHLNKTEHPKYLDYYTPHTLDLLAEYYQEDIKFFRYEKPKLLQPS